MMNRHTPRKPLNDNANVISKPVASDPTHNGIVSPAWGATQRSSAVTIPTVAPVDAQGLRATLLLVAPVIVIAV